MSDNDRADQISARLAAATPGPWVREGREVYRGCSCNGEFLTSTTHDPDADLIANAPADLAWLLSERKRLLAAVEAAERAGAVKALRSLADSFDDRDQVWINRQADALENGASL